MDLLGHPAPRCLGIGVRLRLKSDLEQVSHLRELERSRVADLHHPHPSETQLAPSDPRNFDPAAPSLT